MVRHVHVKEPAPGCGGGAKEDGELSGSEDEDFPWESDLWNASDWGPVPTPALPAQQQEAPRRSGAVAGRRAIPEQDDAVFSESIARHLESLKDSICREHDVVSNQLQRTINALQRENRDLRSKLAPSISTWQADITDMASMLGASGTTAKASSWRGSPSRCVIAEGVRFDCIGGVESPRGRSIAGGASSRLTASSRIRSRSYSKSCEAHTYRLPETEGCSSAGDAEVDLPSEPLVGPQRIPEKMGSELFEYDLHDVWQTRLQRGPTSTELLRPWTSDQSVKTTSNNSTGAVPAVQGRKACRMVLSPGSNMYVVWQVMFTAVLCYELVLFPMDVFDLPAAAILQNVYWGTTLFWTCDLALTFFTGFFSQDGLYVSSHRAIALNYLRTWFCMDTVIILLDWFFILSNGHTSTTLNVGRPFRVLRITRLLRLLRLRKMRTAMHNLDDIVNSLYLSCIKSIFVNMAGILVMSHFFGCFWFLVGTMDVQGYDSWVEAYDMQAYGWDYKYVTSLHWSITQFTPGSMHIQPQNVPERAFAVLMLVMGMVIFSSIISNVTAAVNSLKRITARYDVSLAVLRRFFRQESISNELMIRVLRYVERVIKPKMLRVDTNDVELIRLLPRPLYMEVVLEIYDQDLVVLPFFAVLKDLAANVMSKVCCQALSHVSLSRKAELFCQGDKADAAFFLTHGKAEYCMEYSRVTILEAKSPHTKSVPICEAILWTPWHMYGRMMALSECEMFQIKASVFREVVASNQRVMPLAKQYSAEFVKGLNELLHAGLPISDLVNISAATDILGGYQAAQRQKPARSL